MRTLNLNKRTIYLAKRLSVEIVNGNQIEKYDTPVKLKLNHLPISGDSDTQTYGERFNQGHRSVVDLKTGEMFTENDRVYLDGASPFEKPSWYADKSHEGEEPAPGEYANYRVQAVREGLNCTLVYFERLVGRE